MQGFDDIIKMFIQNASGHKSRRENRRGKGTAKKLQVSETLVQEIPFVSHGSFAEEEACGGNLHIKWH